MKLSPVVISGCSGGGKSTLLAELASRGFAVVEEPGRRIVAEELAGEGAALPWVDLAAFARRAVDMAIADFATAGRQRGWTFFDRGLVDAAAALQHAQGGDAIERWGAACRYHEQVFLTPPWPEIYVHDPERRHGFEEAAAEYDRLVSAYSALGYRLVILPKAAVSLRADYLLTCLSTA